MNTTPPVSRAVRRALVVVIVVVSMAVGVVPVLMRFAAGNGIVPDNRFGGPTFIGVTPAKEVPAADPDARGIFVRRADNSVIIATNFTKWHRIKDDDAGEVRHEIAFDGAPLEKEVVVTRDTMLYRDATDMNGTVVDGKVQQVVKPGVIDDIRNDALVQVWGEARGDRLIARVIVYHYLPA